MQKKEDVEVEGMVQGLLTLSDRSRGFVPINRRRKREGCRPATGVVEFVVVWV